jgi:hypothetical protein
MLGYLFLSGRTDWAAGHVELTSRTPESMLRTDNWLSSGSSRIVGCVTDLSVWLCQAGPTHRVGGDHGPLPRRVRPPLNHGGWPAAATHQSDREGPGQAPEGDRGADVRPRSIRPRHHHVAAGQSGLCTGCVHAPYVSGVCAAHRATSSSVGPRQNQADGWRIMQVVVAWATSFPCSSTTLPSAVAVLRPAWMTLPSAVSV